MCIRILLLCCLLSRMAFAQSHDTISTDKGPLDIHPVKHASMVLSWDNRNIFVDPVGGAAPFKDFRPDLILITDIHQDHLDVATLEAVNTPDTWIVAPQAVADKLPSTLKGKLLVLSNDQEVYKLGINISAMPMYNTTSGRTDKHVKGRGNGYLLELGGKRIYISGDTEDIPEMRALKEIDLAFVCMNLPYTMDVNQAASAVLDFKPAVVYPYHYRGQNPEAFKKLVNAKDKKIEVRVRDWYEN